MIQENSTKQILKRLRNKLVKASLVAVLLLTIENPGQAAQHKLTKISALYFNSNHSLVIETENRQEIILLRESSEQDPEEKIFLANSKLDKSIPRILSQGSLKLELIDSKSDSRSWYKSKDQVELRLSDDSGKKLDTKLKPILDGLAYQIDISQIETSTPNFKQEVKPESISTIQAQTNQPEALKLNVSLTDKSLYAFSQSKSAVESFLETVDLELAKSPEFIDETFLKIDSASLTQIATALENKGDSSNAFRAYKEALELDPKNLNARLGLARTTNDKVEKLENFLLSIDDQALEEVGKEWLAQGLASQDVQSISKALVPYQLSVLKNPKSPETRFAYAEVLFKSGPEYYEQAAKRYLESAILAKTLFNTGEENYKALLRKSTESLIKTLTMIGDQGSALKYCDSYLGLGFSNFLDGRSIAGIIKEIKFNRNPFLDS